MSEYFAIICKLGIEKLTAHGYSFTACKSDCSYRLQWEKADIMYYQSYLNIQLNTIVRPIPVDALLRSNVYCHNHCIDLERYYKVGL